MNEKNLLSRFIPIFLLQPFFRYCGRSILLLFFSYTTMAIVSRFVTRLVFLIERINLRNSRRSVDLMRHLIGSTNFDICVASGSSVFFNLSTNEVGREEHFVPLKRAVKSQRMAV